MSKQPGKDAVRLLRWRDVYREAELYKAAVRLYTKPLFLWRKALSVSSDGKTLYDLAGMKTLFEAAGIVEIDAVWSDR